MEYSKDRLSFFAIHNPKTMPTLLYLMALADEERDGFVNVEFISTILDQETFETEEYIERLVEADFIRLLPAVSQYGEPMYHVL